MANREKLMEKAQKALQKGKFKDALKLYEKILDDEPNDVRVVLRKGEMEEKLGFPSEAEESYLFVAQKYSDDGFYPKAIAIYKKIIKINAENMDVHLQLGTLYKKLHIDNEAKVYFEKVANYYKANGFKAEYIQVVKQMAEFAGEDTGSKIDLAQEYLEQGDRDQAIEQFKAASQRLFESRNVRELDLLVEKMERLGMEDPDTQAIQIKTYMEAGEPKKALRIIQKVHLAYPKNSDNLEMLATCFVTLKQPDKAASVYDELIGIYNDSGEIEKCKRTQSLKAALPIKQSTSAKTNKPSFESSLGEKSSDDPDLDALASFDEAPFAESTAHATQIHQKEKLQSKNIEEDSMDDLDFILSSEFSVPNEVHQELNVNTKRKAPLDDLEKSKAQGVIPKIPQDDEDLPTSEMNVNFDNYEKMEKAEFSQEIDFSDLSIENAGSKVVDPFSEDVSELSFQSFEKPIEKSEISEEEISGLIDNEDSRSVITNPPNPISMSVLEKELTKDDSGMDVDILELSISHAVEVNNNDDPSSDEQSLTGFEDFQAKTNEKSELSVNEEEFVMVHESLEESSLDDISKEESISDWSVPADQSVFGKAISSSKPLSLEDDSILDGEDWALDLGSSSDMPLEEATQYDASNQTQVDVSVDDEPLLDAEDENFEVDEKIDQGTHVSNEVEDSPEALDLGDELSFDSISFAADDSSENLDLLDVEPQGVVLGEEDAEEDASMSLLELPDEINVEGDEILFEDEVAFSKPLSIQDSLDADIEEVVEQKYETSLEDEPAPDVERKSAPNTDLDAIMFETDNSFPEFEPSNAGGKLPDSITETGFFDLSDALKDEIEDLEKSFREEKEENLEEEFLTPEEVILEFKKGVARTIDKSDTQTYYNLGVAYREMGLIDEAISSFEIAQKGAEYKVDAASMIGICLMLKKEYTAALKTFEEILHGLSYQDPKTLGVRYEMGECYIALGRHVEAYKEFAKIRDVDGHYRDVNTRAKELAFNLGIKETEPSAHTGKIIVNLKERKKNKL